MVRVGVGLSQGMLTMFGVRFTSRVKVELVLGLG